VKSLPTLPSVNRTAGRQIDTPAKKYLRSVTSTDVAVVADAISAPIGAALIAIMALVGMQHSGHIGVSR
jgi:hypothetical protein